MISAFETYLLFQLDTVVKALGLLSVLGFSVVAVMAAYRFIELDEEEREVFDKTYNRCWQTLIVLFALTTFVPDSKTVAAMIVLPAITSDKVIETVTPEAREVYDLAKKALRQLSHEHAALAAEE